MIAAEIQRPQLVDPMSVAMLDARFSEPTPNRYSFRSINGLAVDTFWSFAETRQVPPFRVAQVMVFPPDHGDGSLTFVAVAVDENSGAD